MGGILGIIGAILPLAIKLLSWFLDKAQADKEMMELFYKFVEKFATEYLNSVKLANWAKAQMEELKNKPFEETK